jgi:dolichol-phosphate mannosyltransferase
MPAGATEEGAKVWLVLPTYNEASNLEPVVAAVREHLRQPRRILVVDDSSPDGTGEIAERLAASNEDVSVLRAARGVSGPPTSQGFARRWRRCEPSSRWTPTSPTIPQTCRAARRRVRYACVLGSRYVPGGGGRMGPASAVISRGGCAYAGRARLDVRPHGGFKVLRRVVLEAIDLASISAFGYAFQVETTYRAIRAGFRVVELPIVFRDRRVVSQDDQGHRARGGVACRHAASQVPWRRAQPPSARSTKTSTACCRRS